ncbi:hypothetical protein [Motilimonas pumila]|uniref:Uncharacterized protein n=1 Tax=Motilimonas pumila TaxID=2303987 RepID=A0A418YB88_9GAMM|nr:hypothetical protein [Motilimonas pumila]RJG40231.1 hypothetical protein D1Z90_16385 [Motilimonas pumila]
MSNKLYRVTYFSEDGCKGQMTLETPYYICRNHDTELCIYDEKAYLGSDDMLQLMINQQLQQTADWCVVNVEALLI